jgi:hypothetical protein
MGTGAVLRKCRAISAQQFGDSQIYTETQIMALINVGNVDRRSTEANVRPFRGVRPGCNY